MIKRLFVKYKQIILYLLFGITTTVVNWCVYTPIHNLLDLDMTLSNAIAWLTASLYAFFTNKLFVFRSKEVTGKVLLQEGIKFIGTRTLSGVVEVFLPTALFAIGLNQELLGVEGGVAKASVSIMIITINYLLSKFLIFRKK